MPGGVDGETGKVDDRYHEAGHSDMRLGTIDNVGAGNLTNQIRDFDLVTEKHWCKL